MSDEAETPQLRQARIRQQKREAKLKAQGQERLDKITTLSGRTAETMRNASPLAMPSVSQSPTPAREITGAPSVGQTSDQEQMRLQEEYMRVLLSGTQQGQAASGQETGMSAEDDPMVKMMQAMLGNISGSMGGNMSSDQDASGAGGLPFSAEDISKMTGVPSFLTSMFLGGKQEVPPTPQEISAERTWKILRVVVFVIIGLYTVFTVDRGIEAFGQSPPAPATAQNPFVVFSMGELLVNGARIVLSGRPMSRSGIKSWIQSGKDIGRDGAILVFMLGFYSWWKGYT